MCGERGTLLHGRWECKLVQPLRKTVWRFLKKLKIELPYDPAMALLVIYPKDTNIVIQRGHMHPNVYSSNVHHSQNMERAQMPIDWWRDKEDVVYIYNGMLLSHQKEWNLAICNDMVGTRGYYAKRNKSVRERQIPYDFTHMWNLKNKTCERTNSKTETDP